MKNWLSIIVAVALVAALCGSGWSFENPAIRSPVGSGTVPPSSIQSGLVSSPNPIDVSGNLAITGNVRGGRHFRGTVPYRSTTDFRASIGSSSLDSFLRDSASPEDFGRYAGGYRPYYAPAGTVTGSYRPFYSPTGTVAVTQAGRSGVFMPATTKIRGLAGSARSGLGADGFDVGDGLQEQTLPGWDASSVGLRLRGPQSQISAFGEPRPMSRTPQEIEKLISDELGGELSGRGLKNLWAEGLKTEQYQDQVEQLQRELKQIGDETTDLKQTLIAEDERLRDLREADSLPTEIEPSEGAKQLFDPPVADGEAGTQGIPLMQPATGGLDAYESAGGGPGTIKGTWQSVEEMRQQIDSLTAAQAQGSASEVQQEDFEQLLGSLTDENKSWVPAEQSPSSKKTSPLDKLGRFPRSAEDVLDWSGQPPRLPTRVGAAGDTYSAKLLRGTSSDVAGTSVRTFGRVQSKPSVEPSQSGVDASAGSDISSRARAILGKHESYAAFWEDKFDQYLAAGETYLKQGRYYRAVDAYTLASIYKSDAPRAYAGRSLALFAAGEYMSSALFLSRELEICPEYAASKVDLVAVLGGKDKLAKRIADAEECLELCREPGSGLSSEAELAFLLGYVYYQMDRLGEAKKAIDAAYEKLPDSKAVLAVKKAIESAMAGSQPAIK